MHPFASGSSIVTLSRHPSGGGAGPSGLGGPGKRNVNKPAWTKDKT